MYKYFCFTLIGIITVVIPRQYALAQAVSPVINQRTTLIAKSDIALNNRIAKLTAMNARIANYKHLTNDEKIMLQNSVTGSISTMTALKAKIDSDTDLAVLKADAASITKNYRIYELILPSERSMAAADNALGSLAEYQTMIIGLQKKVSAAKSAGKNTLTAEASLADASAKLAEATMKGRDLVVALTGLQPDRGTTDIQKSNAAAIASAQNDRKVIQTDVAIAHTDIMTARATLKSLGK